MAQQEARLELPTGGPYSNWGEWAALLIGAIDESLTDLEAWYDSSKPDVLTTLNEVRWILPQLAACVAALEIVPMKFFVVSHTETQNTSGGSTSADTYNKHSLNHEDYDPDDLVSLSSGDAIIQSGTWLFIGLPAVYRPNNNHAAIYNVSSSTRVALGVSGFNDASVAVGAIPTVLYPVVLSAQTTLRLEVYSQSAQSGNGLGVANNKTGGEKFAYLIGLKMA